LQLPAFLTVILAAAFFQEILPKKFAQNLPLNKILSRPNGPYINLSNPRGKRIGGRVDVICGAHTTNIERDQTWP